MLSYTFTAPNAAPRNFSAVVESAFSANFSWLPPEPENQNGIITSYVINITDDDSGDSFEVSTTNTSLTLDSSLRPYRTYTCSMAAETSVGQGPFSSEVNFTTFEHGKIVIILSATHSSSLCNSSWRTNHQCFKKKW